MIGSATNWTTLLSTPGNVEVVQRFALGTLSGREFYSRFKGTKSCGEVRGLIRSGTGRARKVARQALRRRGLL